MNNIRFSNWINENQLISFIVLWAGLGGAIYGSISLLEPFVPAATASANWWNLARLLFSISTSLAIIELLYILYMRTTVGALACDCLLTTDGAKKFEKELARTDFLRIFSSKGENARDLLLNAHATGNFGTRNIRIQVLLRQNGTEVRKQELESEIKRWELDIKRIFENGNFRLILDYAFYTSPVMLAGFIFDSRTAMLAWYSRIDQPNRYRSPARLPFFEVQSASESGKKLIDAAINTFDCHFRNSTGAP